MDYCPFCELASGNVGLDLIAFQTPNVFVIPALKQRPLNRGHMLVLPTTHVVRMINLESSLVQELYAVAGRVSMAGRKVFGATGSTLFLNDEAPDQQLYHLHIHVVPRRSGDEFRIPDPMIEELSHEERRRQAILMRGALG
jgi:histidine triad (HIT) family protein